MAEGLWDHYYREGGLASSIEDFPPATRAAVEGRWRQAFEELPDGATILDIGTGAGALPALASQVASAGRRLQVIGVDPAQQGGPGPTPGGHCQIEFRGGIRAEELPFDDRQFDLVCSQFALEYAALPAALDEACRVCGGRLLALVHDADGVVVRQNAPIAEQVAWLLEPDGLLDTLAAHARRPGKSTAERLGAQAGLLRQRVQTQENPSFLQAVARAVGEVLQQVDHRPTGENRSMVAQFRGQLHNQAQRMAALASAALTHTDVAALGEGIRANGLIEVQLEAARSPDGRHRFGHWLTARRPPAPAREATASKR